MDPGLGSADDQMARAETMLAYLIRSRHLSREEVVAEFARTAKELGCSATLSLTQLDRLRFGDLLGEPRPGTVRVLERQFGRDIQELLSPAGLTNRAAADAAQDGRSSTAETLEGRPHAGGAGQQPAALIGASDLGIAHGRPMDSDKFDPSGHPRQQGRRAPMPYTPGWHWPPAAA